jgi:bacillopeptidase F (M6 metalloprotease family)
LDLRAYENSRIQVAFRVTTTASDARGLYIDDVSLETGPTLFASPQGFEASFENWSVEGGVWSVGTPSGAGAPAAHGGAKVAGTVLTGNYPYATNARLISPEFLVPPKTQLPKLRYWYWYQILSGAFGYLDVRVEGGAWQQLSSTQVAGEATGWTQGSLDLRPYENQRIQVAFRLTTNNDTGRGLYIDDVSLE